MLKKSKILILLFFCSICCVSFAAKCKCCGVRVSQGVFERRFGGDWEKAMEVYSKDPHNHEKICYLRHIYAYCNGKVDKKTQIKYLKDAANNAFWRKVQHINPKFFIIVDEYSFYEDVLKKFGSNEPCLKKYVSACKEHSRKTFASLRKDYKIKGKNGKDILVSALQTKNGYIAMLDPETAWQHFNLESRYKEYKNMNWVVFRVHPCDEFTLVPEEKYDEYIYAEKWEAFKEICQELGAKKINFEYLAKDNKKYSVRVDGEATVAFWAHAKMAYDQAKEIDKEVKSQSVISFSGSSVPDDPCRDPYLKKWIKQDPFFESLRNRRMKSRNRLTKDAAKFLYQSSDKFSLDTSAEIKVLWWATLKSNVKINKEEKYRIEWNLEVEFPDQNTAKELEVSSVCDEVSVNNISEKEIIKKESWWDITTWF